MQDQREGPGKDDEMKYALFDVMACGLGGRRGREERPRRPTVLPVAVGARGLSCASESKIPLWNLTPLIAKFAC